MCLEPDREVARIRASAITQLTHGFGAGVDALGARVSRLGTELTPEQPQPAEMIERLAPRAQV
jgi:hypothetical protein